ncbi:RNA methyltransferase [Alteromonas sp. 345S023]|uniref:RNA methyltransferase n=1 Tax=Alteromonas profundi TaxID=2696062 RepID=A0A7X5LLZ4_9ALTE|nr:RNA methyltransferase [Alteromonas profundi]NDV91369.1 RNA methyltransferase [Alteromonas profundi]
MKLEDVKKLHQKKYRNQFKHYLVEGEHLVLELVKALGDKDASITLYVTEDYLGWAKNVASDFTILVVTEKQMAQISDTKTPQGIIACVPLPDNKTITNRSAASKYIYLHEVQDPGNLGTILRSLAWFGNFSLMLSPNSVDPFNSKVVRASMGAIFHVPIELEVSLATLESRFSEFAYLDMQGTAISDSQFNAYQCYLFGNEARGVPRDALLRVGAHGFTIAGSGKIDSLNLASAVNICVYQLSQ